MIPSSSEVIWELLRHNNISLATLADEACLLPSDLYSIVEQNKPVSPAVSAAICGVVGWEPGAMMAIDLAYRAAHSQEFDPYTEDK